jgi:hypothetical protein
MKSIIYAITLSLPLMASNAATITTESLPLVGENNTNPSVAGDVFAASSNLGENNTNIDIDSKPSSMTQLKKFVHSPMGMVGIGSVGLLSIGGLIYAALHKKSTPPNTNGGKSNGGSTVINPVPPSKSVTSSTTTGSNSATAGKSSAPQSTTTIPVSSSTANSTASSTVVGTNTATKTVTNSIPTSTSTATKSVQSNGTLTNTNKPNASMTSSTASVGAAALVASTTQSNGTSSTTNKSNTSLTNNSNINSVSTINTTSSNNVSPQLNGSISTTVTNTPNMSQPVGANGAPISPISNNTSNVNSPDLNPNPSKELQFSSIVDLTPSNSSEAINNQSNSNIVLTQFSNKEIEEHIKYLNNFLSSNMDSLYYKNGIINVSKIVKLEGNTFDFCTSIRTSEVVKNQFRNPNKHPNNIQDVQLNPNAIMAAIGKTSQHEFKGINFSILNMSQLLNDTLLNDLSKNPKIEKIIFKSSKLNNDSLVMLGRHLSNTNGFENLKEINTMNDTKERTLKNKFSNDAIVQLQSIVQKRNQIINQFNENLVKNSDEKDNKNNKNNIEEMKRPTLDIKFDGDNNSN